MPVARLDRTTAICGIVKQVKVVGSHVSYVSVNFPLNRCRKVVCKRVNESRVFEGQKERENGESTIPESLSFVGRRNNSLLVRKFSQRMTRKKETEELSRVPKNRKLLCEVAFEVAFPTPPE